MNRQQERFVRNESLFREVNERISDVNESFDVENETEFLCECGNEDCLETVALTPAEYERIRQEGDRFVLKPGHEDEAVEDVVERHPGFIVIVKRGEAGEDARAHDPRS